MCVRLAPVAVESRDCLDESLIQKQHKTQEGLTATTFHNNRNLALYYPSSHAGRAIPASGPETRALSRISGFTGEGAEARSRGALPLQGGGERGGGGRWHVLAEGSNKT